MKNIRIGQSTDIHRLEEGLRLTLGGIVIDSPVGCVAHSDGDILVHVITEALLGAMGLGDLGESFSDNDELNKDRSSIEMLQEVLIILMEKNYYIINIDTIIITEKPHLSKYKNAIKENLVRVLNIDSSCVNVKATRGEKLGYIGRGEGIMAQAVILIDKYVK